MRGEEKGVKMGLDFFLRGGSGGVTPSETELQSTAYLFEKVSRGKVSHRSRYIQIS